VGVFPIAPAIRSVHSLYEACSAAVGSRLQAAPSHGTARKTVSCTSAFGSPACEFAMYSCTRVAMTASENHGPNQAAFGRSAILASSVRLAPVAPA
jgi:hypothetical protein